MTFTESDINAFFEEHGPVGYDCGNCPSIHVECACGPLVDYDAAHMIKVMSATKPKAEPMSNAWTANSGKYFKFRWIIEGGSTYEYARIEADVYDHMAGLDDGYDIEAYSDVYNAYVPFKKIKPKTCTTCYRKHPDDGCADVGCLHNCEAEVRGNG